MKKNNFKINVWDLLQSAGQIDHFNFENENIQEIQWINEKWIKWNITIQSFDKDALLVTLTNVQTDIIEPCETCLKEYTRHVKITEYQAKFQKEIDPNEISDEEIFKIDGNENIDIKDMITHAIILQEPIAKKCDTCTKKSSEEADDFDDNEYLEWTSNITFS